MCLNVITSVPEMVRKGVMVAERTSSDNDNKKITGVIFVETLSERQRPKREKDESSCK